MSKLKFIDKWNKFCQIPEYHYLCDRISAMSDYGLGCPRLEKGYLVRIALFLLLVFDFQTSDFPSFIEQIPLDYLER